MAQVSVQGVSRRFGTVTALDQVSVDFDDGGFYALLGPSGSGKTTLLRMIAGFDFPDAGQIHIAGQPVETVPVEKREIGMMFQNYALFPNMSVFDNVGFGLSVRHVGKQEIAQRVGEALELVHLTGFDKRKPHQLSGGQRQRVALARAIVTRPRVLLLDEPLSALDKSLRVEMQVELKRIQREVGITTIFVTHDQEEALTLSDRIGILNEGRLIQEGPPLEIYERPRTAFAARFLGEANLFPVTTGGAGGLTLSDGTSIKTENPAGGAGQVAVRPEKILLQPAGEPAPEGANSIEATVQQHIFAGSSLTYLLVWQGQPLKVFVQNRSGNVIRPGEVVRLSWSPGDTVVLEG